MRKAIPVTTRPSPRASGGPAVGPKSHRLGDPSRPRPPGADLPQASPRSGAGGSQARRSASERLALQERRSLGSLLLAAACARGPGRLLHRAEEGAHEGHGVLEADEGLVRILQEGLELVNLCLMPTTPAHPGQALAARLRLPPVRPPTHRAVRTAAVLHESANIRAGHPGRRPPSSPHRRAPDPLTPACRNPTNRSRQPKPKPTAGHHRKTRRPGR